MTIFRNLRSEVVCGFTASEQHAVELTNRDSNIFLHDFCTENSFGWFLEQHGLGRER